MSGHEVSRGPELAGQMVVVNGGSAGIGLETGRRARAEGAKLILTGCNSERLDQAARELGALTSAALDATDFERLLRAAGGICAASPANNKKWNLPRGLASTKWEPKWLRPFLGGSVA